MDRHQTNGHTNKEKHPRVINMDEQSCGHPGCLGVCLALGVGRLLREREISVETWRVSRSWVKWGRGWQGEEVAIAVAPRWQGAQQVRETEPQRGPCGGRTGRREPCETGDRGHGQHPAWPCSSSAVEGVCRGGAGKGGAGTELKDEPGCSESVH